MKRDEAPNPLAVLGLAAAGLRAEHLPAKVVKCCRQRILDTLGCMVAGYHAGIADAIRSYVLAQGGAHEATLLPHGQKTTAALAGLAHGSYIHGLELSDGKDHVPNAQRRMPRSGRRPQRARPLSDADRSGH